MSQSGQDGDSPEDTKMEGTGQRESISIEALAERVYRMLLRDIRVERTRGAHPRRKLE